MQVCYCQSSVDSQFKYVNSQIQWLQILRKNTSELSKLNHFNSYLFFCMIYKYVRIWSMTLWLFMPAINIYEHPWKYFPIFKWLGDWLTHALSYFREEKQQNKKLMWRFSCIQVTWRIIDRRIYTLSVSSILMDLYVLSKLQRD